MREEEVLGEGSVDKKLCGSREIEGILHQHVRVSSKHGHARRSRPCNFPLTPCVEAHTARGHKEFLRPRVRGVGFHIPYPRDGW